MDKYPNMKAYRVSLRSLQGEEFLHVCVSTRPDFAAMGARRQVRDKHGVKVEVTHVEYIGRAAEIFPNDY